MPTIYKRAKLETGFNNLKIPSIWQGNICPSQFNPLSTEFELIFQENYSLSSHLGHVSVFRTFLTQDDSCEQNTLNSRFGLSIYGSMENRGFSIQKLWVMEIVQDKLWEST